MKVQDERFGVCDQQVRPSEPALHDCRSAHRPGFSFYSWYRRYLGIFPFLKLLFGTLRNSRKGPPVPLHFHQIFCFFLDGKNLSLIRFDELAMDGGFAGAIEVARETMASSHEVKR